MPKHRRHPGRSRRQPRLKTNLKRLTVVIDDKGYRGSLRAYVWQEGFAGSNLLTHVQSNVESAKAEAQQVLIENIGEVQIDWRTELGPAGLFGSEVARHA